MAAPRLWWQLVLAFALSLLLLCGLIGWLQNVHMVTSNGMYKSLQAGPWIRDYWHARLDPSNYLYFPLYGAMSRLLDELGVARGMAWKQFAYLNAFWASIATVLVYAFVHRVSGSARVAALAALFHLGCGTVLLLAVINEDIMPGYTIVLGSMLLAGLWFDRPTHPRVIAVAALFTIGWLVEWRLMFPTLPAFGLALLVAPGTLRRRLALCVTLVVSVVAVAGIVQQIWEGHTGAVGLHDLLWTGKGLATGWAGFAWGKLWMMLGGLGCYLLMISSFALPQEAQAELLVLSLSVGVQLAILVGAVIVLWPRRHEPGVRAIAVVFLGTLAAGQVLNLYSQPHDPQMQINVMAWLTVAWAAILAAALARPRPGVMALLTLLSLAPLVANVAVFAAWRGGDAKAVAGIEELARRYPPDRTVYIYWGFEPATMWKFALWGQTWDMDGDVDLARAPSDKPRFKWIAVTGAAVRHPDWTPEQHAASIKQQIELALDRGYDVLVADVWTWSQDELTTALGSLAASTRAAAIYAALHDAYVAEPVYTDPRGYRYYRLRRR